MYIKYVWLNELQFKTVCIHPYIHIVQYFQNMIGREGERERVYMYDCIYVAWD